MYTKKPKLSDSLKNELKIENKFTFGKVLWPLASLCLAIGVGIYLYGVYQKEKEKPSDNALKNPNEKIQSKPDVDPNEEIEEEAAATPAPAPVATPPTLQPTTEDYTVVEGDTLGAIATARGLTIAEVTNANPGLVAESLQIGQVIKIPKK